MKYISAGNIMVDTVHFINGRKNRHQIGGPAGFAYSGLLLFSDDSLLLANVGSDFDKYVGEWMKVNKVNSSAINVIAEFCNHTDLVYHEDGSYSAMSFENDVESGQFAENIGFLKTRISEIEEVTKNKDVDGLYMAQNVDKFFWDQMGKIRDRDDFRVVWEIEGPVSNKKYMDKVLYAMQFVDVFSINLKEAINLTGIEDEARIIDFLKDLPVGMVLFRVGERGLYTIYDKKAYFHPSVLDFGVVDPTGCGNTSTGATVYGYCNFPDDPIMVGAIANVSAAQNARQFGMIPNCNAVREETQKKIDEIYKNYIY